MCSAQIVVVFMSLGFIGFVTVLHIIGKVSPASLLISCCDGAAQLNECERHTCGQRKGEVAHSSGLTTSCGKKSCCFAADARIEARTCAHWQTDGSSCAAPRPQQTAHATLLGLALSELCEKLGLCRSCVASMGWAAAASVMMQPSQSKRGGLWAMEAAGVICAGLNKGARIDTARMPAP